MTSKRPVPADMLLVNERRRRIQLAAQPPGEPQTPPIHVDADEIFSADEDQLVDEPQAAPQPAPTSRGVLLRKAMSSVSLAHIGWSGPIDHPLLQAALACQPVADHDAVAYARLFGAQAGAHDGGPALEVYLDDGDLTLLRTRPEEQPDALERAAQLPDRLTGDGLSSSEIVSSVLAAYRRAALSCAWYERLGMTPSAQAHREREETAVTMLSTLRALLGER